jgi:hypothetical protein
MRKALLVITGIILLAVVIGVSYYKSVRNETRTLEAYEQGKQEEAATREQYRARLDSLTYLIEQQRDEHNQSVWMREMAYRLTYDSLLKALEESYTREDSLKNELASLKKRGKKSNARISPSVRKSSRHEQILSYYRKRYQSLPKDLSPYERRVALAEIREETAQKFSITLQELDEIRRTGKLDY